MKQTHWVTCGVQSESELYSALYCVNRLVWLWHSFKDVSHHNFLPLTSHEVLISQALTARELQKKTHTFGGLTGDTVHLTQISRGCA